MRNYSGLITFLLCFLFMLPVVNAQEKIYSVLFAVYSNDTVILKNFAVQEGLQTHFPTSNTGYYVEILSYSNEKLFQANLGISFTIHVMTAPGELPEIITELEEVLVQLRLPYFDDAKRIAVYHLDKKILDLDLADYICNKNNLCEAELGENKINCAQDCGTTTPQGGPSKSIYIYVVIIAAIIVIIIFFIYKIKVARE